MLFKPLNGQCLIRLFCFLPTRTSPILLSLMRQIMLLGLVSSRKKGGKGVDEGL